MSSVVLYAQISAVCILFLMLIAVKANRGIFWRAQRRGFLAVAVSNMLLFTLDAVWIFVDSRQLPVSVGCNWLLNGTYYALSGLMGYI